MTEPTPRPWKLVHNYRDKMAIVGPANNGRDVTSDRVCNLPHRKNGEGEANAAFIVRAVNCHDALVDALQNLVAAVDAAGPRYVPDIVFRSAETARAALAKVEEES